MGLWVAGAVVELNEAPRRRRGTREEKEGRRTLKERKLDPNGKEMLEDPVAGKM